MIINMEWDGFDKFRRTIYDKALDETSDNAGKQFFEKAVSGMYLGEIARLVMRDSINRNLLPDDPGSRLFTTPGAFTTERMAIGNADQTRNFDAVEEILCRAGATRVTRLDKMTVRKICQFVSTRAARLSAAAITAVLTWMDHGLVHPHTIGSESIFGLHIISTTQNHFTNNSNFVIVCLIKREFPFISNI